MRQRALSGHLVNNELNAGKSTVCGAGRLSLSTHLPTKEFVCIFIEHGLPHCSEIKRGDHARQGDRRPFGEFKFLSVR